MKTKLSVLMFAVATAQIAFAESFPGYRYPAIFAEQRTSEGSPEFATIFATLANVSLPNRDVAIRYNVRTGRVTTARWMTKGNYEFQLPAMGLHGPLRPSEENKMLLILSVEKITDIQTQKMALVGIYWGSGPQ
jgi:hypothetical protein